MDSKSEELLNKCVNLFLKRERQTIYKYFKDLISQFGENPYGKTMKVSSLCDDDPEFLRLYYNTSITISKDENNLGHVNTTVTFGPSREHELYLEILKHHVN